MQFKDNQTVQNFIHEYLELCRKYNLCICTINNNGTEDLMLDTISDYDYSDFFFDDKGRPISFYDVYFIEAIEKNYDEELF